jgi:hypothetical protein
LAVGVDRDRRVADRRRRRMPVGVERRTGFDRRMPPRHLPSHWYLRGLRAYRRNPRTVFLILALFTALNIADLILTQLALSQGATEVNPAMRALFDIHPIWAALVKAAVGMIVAEVIWKWRRHRSALVLSIAITVAMGLIFVRHLILAPML